MSTNMEFEYYYNNVPGTGKVRNNLVYTSLINKEKTVFVKWFHNDTEYHMGQNQVVDPNLMNAKFKRELDFLREIEKYNKDMIPKILEIDTEEQKIYFEIDGVDFWERANCDQANYEKVVPDWQSQMLEILSCYKDIGWYKFSLHPSSYFVVDGKLKSINYFFTYHKDEPAVTLQEHRSHISIERQEKMESIMRAFNMNWHDKVPFDSLQKLCFESFRSNYPKDFIDAALKIYAD